MKLQDALDHVVAYGPIGSSSIPCTGSSSRAKKIRALLRLLALEFIRCRRNERGRHVYYIDDSCRTEPYYHGGRLCAYRKDLEEYRDRR
jgi:hypothetical protein